MVKIADMLRLFDTDGCETPQDEQDKYNEKWEDGYATLNKNPSAAKMQKFMDYLGTIEKKYECSGVCNKQKVYYFSDINFGIPT